MTSAIEKIRVKCPSCRQVYEAFHRASINATLDPQLAADEDYVTRMSTGTCPDCGRAVNLGMLIVRDDIWMFLDSPGSDDAAGDG